MNFTFLSTGYLAALLALPVLWWIIRQMPPSPREVVFAPFMLLHGLVSESRAVRRSPWWLLLFRLLLAALLIFVFARPLWHEENTQEAAALPMRVVMVDNGAGAAAHWSEMLATLEEVVTDSALRGQQLWLVESIAASPSPLVFPGWQTPESVRAQGDNVTLHPMPGVRQATLEAMIAALQPAHDLRRIELVWLSDGVSYQQEALPSLLAQFGNVVRYTPRGSELPVVLTGATARAEDITFTLRRASTAGRWDGQILALSAAGELLHTESVHAAVGEQEVEHTFALPEAARGNVARLEIGGERHAGAVWLFGGGMPRRVAGILDGSAPANQPLLTEHYYLTKAVQPLAEVHRGALAVLLERGVTMILWPDNAEIPDIQREALHTWVRQGGVLVRFAGPRLAAAKTEDALLPVRLRGQTLYDGVVTWTSPPQLAEWGAQGPLAGLAVPAGVTVQRQVLADPAEDLTTLTWARLSDGTPVITGKPLGAGMLVLVHTTATPQWSNFALSGAMVEALQRLTDKGEQRGDVPVTGLAQPVTLLDAFGKLAISGTSAPAVDLATIQVPGAHSAPLPGLYRAKAAMVPVNLGPWLSGLSAMPEAEAVMYGEKTSTADITPWLVGALVALFIADSLLPLVWGGRFPRWSRNVALGILVLGLGSTAGHAATDADANAAKQLQLAYVITGDSQVDALSQAGLAALTRELERRTSFEGQPPRGVDLERDALWFAPVLYWPLATASPLSAAAVARLRQFIRSGGLLLLDTRNGQDVTTQDAELSGLGPLLTQLGVGELMPLDAAHVLSRTFYLLKSWPGRWGAGAVLAERLDETVNDGVSPVLITSVDWAGAWAQDAKGRALLPMVAAEAEREMAMRAGVNLVMYALTGNYKADQIHLETIMERMNGGKPADE